MEEKIGHGVWSNHVRFLVWGLVQLEKLRHCVHGGAFGVHVDVRVDVHGDLRAVVAGELLHDLGMHAAHCEHR